MNIKIHEISRKIDNINLVSYFDKYVSSNKILAPLVRKKFRLLIKNNDSILEKMIKKKEEASNTISSLAKKINDLTAENNKLIFQLKDKF